MLSKGNIILQLMLSKGNNILQLVLSKGKVSRVDWLRNFANYKEDYIAALFHVVCRVTVMIFCSRCDDSLDHWPFAHLHLKAFCNLCRVNVI